MSDRPWPVEPVAAGVPGGGGAPGHADGLELALGVHAHPADAGEEPGHVLEHLGERGHRIAGEEPAPGRDHGLGDGLAALEKLAIVVGLRTTAVIGAARPGCRTCRPGRRSRGRSASRPCSRCTRAGAGDTGSRGR